MYRHFHIREYAKLICDFLSNKYSNFLGKYNLMKIIAAEGNHTIIIKYISNTF